MSKTINTTVRINRPAAEVFRLLTTTSELEQWFAEHARVDLAGGSYGFWGRYTPGLPSEAQQQLKGFQQDRSLSYVWHVNGNDTVVEFTLDGELVASSTDIVHLRYPNEFALLLQSRRPQWEMVGQFNAWDLEAPIGDDTQAINRPLCILKKSI